MPGTATAAARTREPNRPANPLERGADRAEHAVLAAVVPAGGRGYRRPAELDRRHLPRLVPDGGGGHQRPVRVRAE